MTRPLAPGSVIGILGGGTVGRRIALAARALGFRVRAFDTDPTCTIGPLAERSLLSTMDDADGAARVLAGCAVVTPSAEEVPPLTLAAVEAAGVPVRPSPAILALAQDRGAERAWLEARGIPLAPWQAAATLDDALGALANLGGRGLLKPCVRAGTGTQVRRVSSPASMVTAWWRFGGMPCVVESEVSVDREFSVVVARGLDGHAVSYPVAESVRDWHDGSPRLLWSVLPAGGETQHARKARRLASMVTERLGTEGLMAVEMFLLTDGRLIVNELVPCPHHTYLGSAQSCITGQEEQLVRAITGLPLGATDAVQQVAVAPIYGDAWRAGASVRIHDALQLPGVALHLHGVERPGAEQRVGHVAVAGESAEHAVAQVMRAAEHLVRGGA